MTKNKGKNQEPTPPHQPRRVTLIEVLVMIAIAAIILRFVYLLTQWRDIVKAVIELKPYEWAILAAFVLFYFFSNRQDKDV